MLQIEEHKSLKELTTFKVGGTAAYFAHLSTKDEVKEFYIFAHQKKLPCSILGGGSNVIFHEGDLSMCVGKISLKGFRKLEENDDSVILEIGAGEIWDEIVAKTVAMGLFGIEAMSAIPGTVGATPVQNVGAYGQEIKDVLVSLDAFDTVTYQCVTLSNEACEFSYRDSVFKGKEKGRYIILSVVLRLTTTHERKSFYPGIDDYFQKNNIVMPTSQNIRDAVISLRKIKLPDPSVIPNCGSFFKNPIIPVSQADVLKEKFPSLPTFVVDETLTKISAGWLIQEAGLKGETINAISVYAQNALVLVNNGKATIQDVEEAVEFIRQRVKEMFDILLEQEPEIIK